MPPKDTDKPRLDTLYDAARKGDVERIAAFVGNEKGGHVTDHDDRKLTMLHHACQGGNAEIVRLILTRGPDIEAADDDGWTPMHYAANGGHAEAIELLVDEGANINAPDKAKRSPLHMAVVSGKNDAVKMLLSNGANKKAKNVAGWNALKYAEEYQNEELIAILEQK